MRKFTMIGMFMGSSIGAYVPLLWGAGIFSMSSIVCTFLGGILGIYLGFKLGKMMGL